MGVKGRKHAPVRMCAVCRQRFPKKELTRYVCPEDLNELEAEGPVHDPDMTQSGRGFYVCGQARCREIFPKMVKGLMKKRVR